MGGAKETDGEEVCNISRGLQGFGTFL